MLTAPEILALNHPPDGEHGNLTKAALLQDVYSVSIQHWRRLCAGQHEINRTLAHSLLERFFRRFPNAPVAPCIVQVLPNGDWLIRVRHEDGPKMARLLRIDVSERMAA